MAEISLVRNWNTWLESQKSKAMAVCAANPCAWLRLSGLQGRGRGRRAEFCRLPSDFTCVPLCHPFHKYRCKAKSKQTRAKPRQSTSRHYQTLSMRNIACMARPPVSWKVLVHTLEKNSPYCLQLCFVMDEGVWSDRLHIFQRVSFDRVVPSRAGCWLVVFTGWW